MALEELRWSAIVLDLIMQVAGKGWGAACVAGLVQALSDILQPLANLCSFWGQQECRGTRSPRACAGSWRSSKRLLRQFGGAWRDDRRLSRGPELEAGLSVAARRRADQVLAEHAQVGVSVELEQDGKLKLRSAKPPRRDHLAMVERSATFWPPASSRSARA